MKKPQVAILASGEGTTAESFVRAGAAGKIDAGLALVICNKKDAGIFARMEGLNRELGLNIRCVLINQQKHPAAPGEKVRPGDQTEAEEAAILDILEAGNFDAICLMGYLKKAGPRLVHRFGGRAEYDSPYQAMMLNTHPGLLPDSMGLWGRHVQEFVLQNRLPFSGQSLIVVAEDYDVGTVITEHKVAVKTDDTPDSLFARVQATEKKFLPRDIDEFIKRRQKYLKGEL
ncbi:MAG TPA: formyltransferase family protein [Candidatus Saccharimonadales bacterium]|nr:formyltransferase family protein [Candidatus Saccharimonadales bacterium]